MATTQQSTSTPPTTKTPATTIPFHLITPTKLPSSSYSTSSPFNPATLNQNAQNHSSTAEAEAPTTDGRRNSSGEILPGVTETWTPKIGRTQSWNQEDLKREMLIGELERTESDRERGRVRGMGTGFSERGGGKGI